MEPECLGTVIHNESRVQFSVGTLDVLQLAPLEVHTRVSEQSLVDKLPFPIQSIQQIVCLQLLRSCINNDFKVLFGPLHELLHKWTLLDLDCLPVFIHFDEEHVVRIQLGLNA